MSKLKYTRGGYALPGSSMAFHTGTWRVQRPVHIHGHAPCHVACPAGENPQAWLRLLEEGNEQGAWEALVAINPLPASTARVCPHFCEAACNRAHYDQAISIHGVERWLGDRALQQHWPLPATQQHSGFAAIAVVGAGPAGLSCAWHLRRLGYPVTLFEAGPLAGGLLRSAIPEYRLPRDVLQGECSRIIDCGIDFRANTRIGRDLSLAELQADFPAVFLGPGTQQGREWSVDGIVQGDLHNALDLLKEWNTVGKLFMPDSVAIVGAGNTAVDTARILRRSGVAEVHLIAHKALPEEGDSSDDCMPVHPREVSQAMEEGVQFHPHRGIRRLILRGEKVVGLEMVHMKKLADGSGTRHRVAFEGTETVLRVGQVIPAIGQQVDFDGLQSLADGAYINADRHGHIHGQQTLFAGGDAIGKGGTVTRAVGDGRRAALAIDAGLRDRPVPADNSDTVGYLQLNVNYFERAARPEEQVLAPGKRKGQAEIVGGLDAHQTVHEAQRCFSCGDCFACDNCWTLCPDSAVLKSRELASDGSHYVFDYDYCKGCGLCAHECPCGFIGMELEG